MSIRKVSELYFVDTLIYFPLTGSNSGTILQISGKYLYAGVALKEEFGVEI